MTEKEKAIKEQLYNANYDKELIKERTIAKELCFKLNNINPKKTNKQNQVIKQLIPNIKDNFVFTTPFQCDFGYNIEIGNNFYCNHNLIILDGNKVKIGNDVFIGPNCVLTTATHPINYKQRNEGLETAHPITIGNNVWLGASVSVLPGVTIGDNVVIGANSLVNKDIPSNSIAVGNPCKVIKAI